MMGPEQEAVLARDTNAASSPGVNKTVWQQYLGGLVMQVQSCLTSSFVVSSVLLLPLHFFFLACDTNAAS